MRCVRGSERDSRSSASELKESHEYRCALSATHGRSLIISSPARPLYEERKRSISEPAAAILPALGTPSLCCWQDVSLVINFQFLRQSLSFKIHGKFVLFISLVDAGFMHVLGWRELIKFITHSLA